MANNPNPEGPQPFPCGGGNEPGCPPQPAVQRAVTAILAANGDPATITQVVTNALAEHGHNQYHKALADQAQKQA